MSDVPPPPNNVTIPRQIWEPWIEIPAEDYVSPRLTRHDFDRLFRTFDLMVQSQSCFQDAMAAYTNGDIENAQRLFGEAKNSLVGGQNEFRSVFMSMMVSAVNQR